MSGRSLKLHPARKVTDRAMFMVAEAIRGAREKAMTDDGEMTNGVMIASSEGDVLYTVTVYKDGRVSMFWDKEAAL